MKNGERFLSAGIYIIAISMFVYLVASGIAITHSDYGHECPTCVIAKVVAK